MALPVHTTGTKPRFNETLVAIIGSLVISVVLATIFVGSPFRALRLAYLDYAHTPAGGAAKSSPVNAPKTEAGTVPPSPAQPGGSQPGAAPK
jgi:hypothetical protein